MDVKTIGIVGAGQMGNGIAHVFALAGYDVLLNDINADVLAAAKPAIEAAMQRQIDRDIITKDAASAALARITLTEKLEDIGPTDLVIEAATEKEDIKTQIFAALQPHLADHTILTSNTSSISITRLASPRLRRPMKH